MRKAVIFHRQLPPGRTAVPLHTARLSEVEGRDLVWALGFCFSSVLHKKRWLIIPDHGGRNMGMTFVPFNDLGSLYV